MTDIFYKQFDQLSFADFEVYSVLPDHPIWSRAEEVIDFSFADQICKPLYSSLGQRPYAPSLKLKVHIVQRYYNLSDREMEEKIMGDLFIKRFLGLPVKFTGFDHSTIGLDRDRVGSKLFDACHHHILAQAKQKGLWGDKKDIWLVDSFHTNGHITFLSAYRLIKQGIVRVLNHLKRANKTLFDLAITDLDLNILTSKLPPKPSQEDFEVSFSQLVVLGYGLLHWFEGDKIRPIFWKWSNQKRQLDSLEKQAILYQILKENVSSERTNDSNKQYKKLDHKERPKNRIRSAVDPEVRNGQKSKKVMFEGDKIQVVTTSRTGLVLNAEPIPGNEADGVRLLELIETIRKTHDVKPHAVVADGAYGYATYRREFKTQEIQFVSPLQRKPNPTGLYRNDQFIFDADSQTVTCPTGQVTSHSVRNNVNAGTQYKFPKKICNACPVKAECTTNKAGRTYFVSDYYEELQEAAKFNETDEAKQMMSVRKSIESKNNELKNHNGLGDARFQTMEKRRSDAKIACIVVNMKQLIKHIGGSLTLGFVRKKIPALTGGH